MNDFEDWVASAKLPYTRLYSTEEWIVDVLKAEREGKPVDARIVAQARHMVNNHPDMSGLNSLLRAVNNVAYSQMIAEEKLIEKYTNKYTVINFRIRPWRESLRVNYAHSLHWQDVQETKDELRKVG
jgi:hypothetical protein